MHKSLVAATLAASVLVSGAALAASKDATGVIKTINAKGHEVTLADGKMYMLPKTFDTKTLKVGEKVLISYDMKKGKMMVSTIKAAT